MPLQRERFSRHRDFIQNLPSTKWYYGSLVERGENECGTVCCAMGWLPAVFPKTFRWTLRDGEYGDVSRCDSATDSDFYELKVGEFFGIPQELEEALFVNAERALYWMLRPDGANPYHLQMEDVTAEDVAHLMGVVLDCYVEGDNDECYADDWTRWFAEKWSEGAGGEARARHLDERRPALLAIIRESEERQING